MPTPIRLQPRDVQMLHSLGIGRYLTVQALEWLHYPTWRANWITHQAAQAEKTAAQRTAYYPTPNLYRRLEGLRGGGYVTSIKRTQERATVVFNRLADVYALTSAGADLLMEHAGINPDGLSIEGQRPRSLQNFEHSVAIAQLYAALRCELETVFADRPQRLELAGWKADHLLARNNYDRLAGRTVVRSGAATVASLPVLPDATFELFMGERRRRYFVELDRGTRPLDSWREKAEAYKAYAGSPELQARYGVNTFALLIVAPTPTRSERIAQEVAKVERGPVSQYFYTEAASVHPVCIRASWRRMAQVDMHTRAVAGRIVESPSVIMQPAALWSQN